MMASSLDKSKKAVLSFLQNVDGQTFDICDVLFRMISETDPEHQVPLFQYVCEIFGTVNSSKKTPISVSDYSAQKPVLEEQYGDVVNSIIKTFCSQNNDESYFYNSLWNTINEALLFDTEAKKIFAFYFVLIDKRIPYFKIDDALLYSMSNERFNELKQKTIREGQKIRFFLKADFSQRSERAALLLSELGITAPTDDDPVAIEEYEKHLMQMVYILREQDTTRRLSSLLDSLQN